MAPKVPDPTTDTRTEQERSLARSRSIKHQRELRAQRASSQALAKFGMERRIKESKQDRMKLATVLVYSADKRIKTAAMMALDPGYSGQSFLAILRTLGLEFHQAASEYEALQKQFAKLKASAELPQLAQETADAAKNRTVTCTRCHGDRTILITEGKGKGKKEREIPCPSCDGKGKVVQLGDYDRLKLTYESLGLTGARGPLINLDMRKVSGDERIEDVAQAVEDVMTIPAQPVAEADDGD